MNDLLISLGLVIAITTIPVMLVARYLKAEKAGLSPALLAVILQLALFHIAGYVLTPQALAIFASILGGTLISSMTLDTTMVKGFIISVCFVLLATLINTAHIDYLDSPTLIEN